MTTIDDKIPMNKLGKELSNAMKDEAYMRFIMYSTIYAGRFHKIGYFDVLVDEYKLQNPNQFNKEGEYK